MPGNGSPSISGANQESSRLSEEYIKAIYDFARNNTNQSFLVVDLSRHFVSHVMALQERTKKIAIYGMPAALLPLYENVLRVSRCPVEIILDRVDDHHCLRGYAHSIRERITCWQRSVVAEEDEHHFLLFGWYAYLYDYKGDGGEWAANINDPETVETLQARFEKYLKGSVPLLL